MKRRTYIHGLGAVGVSGILAGCAGEEPSPAADGGPGTDERRHRSTDAETTDAEPEASTEDESEEPAETLYGTLATSVTDQPNDIGDFESLHVTVDGIWIAPAGGEANGGDQDDQSGEQGTETPGTEEETETPEEKTETETETPEEETETPEEETTTPEEETETPETATPQETETPEGVTETPEEDDHASEDETETPTEEDGAKSDGRGREYVEFDEPQRANLVELQGGNAQLIDETDVEAGEYRFLQLDVSDTEGVLTDGGEAEVRTPGNAPLQFKESFEIRADERTHFVADFAPNRTGRSNRYVIRPVARGTTVLYGDEEYENEDGVDDAEDGKANGESGTDGRGAGGKGNASEGDGEEKNGTETDGTDDESDTDDESGE